MNKIIKLAVSAMIFGILSTGSAYALDSLTVRLENPKSPTYLRDYTITFVALDIQDRAVVVRCYKKAPSEAGFSIFDSDKNLSAGGGTGTCNVTSSIISAEGTYEFYVRASADGDSTQSNSVAVEYKTGGPGAPTNYSKERPSNCSYKIKFRTADDGGRTVKVEVYRSDQTNFDTNDSTRVGSVSLSSNTDGEYTQDVPECGKDYYYAIRAFDNAGIGSDVVGDRIEKVVYPTTTTVSPTQGAISITGAAATKAESEEAVEEATAAQAEETTEAGKILGEATPGKAVGLWSMIAANKWPIAIGALLILAALWIFLRKLREE